MCKAKMIVVVSLLCRYTQYIGICKMIVEDLCKASEINEKKCPPLGFNNCKGI